METHFSKISGQKKRELDSKRSHWAYTKTPEGKKTLSNGQSCLCNDPHNYMSIPHKSRYNDSIENYLGIRQRKKKPQHNH